MTNPGSESTNRKRSKLWETFDNPEAREFLYFCAPALLVGLILRGLMTWQMPFGYMQFDTADFLLTVHRLLSRGHFVIHSKRTFLVPLLYTLPFLLKVPALIVIPIAQHLLGLGVVFMSGLLTRLWVRFWRWVIVPLTLLVAANPNLLWFEHTLMSESVYIFFVFALALAATLFTLRPTSRHFAFLLAALFFTAAARPEGRLLLGFGLLLLVLVDWRNGKTLWLRLAWFAGLACVTLPLTRTGQAGQLLYATVLPLAPDESRVDPEFGRLVRPLRDALRVRPGMTKLQGLEQKLTDMTGDYLKGKGVEDPDTNALCQKLAIEACLNDPWALPGLATRKFLHAANGPVSIGYDEPRLQEKLNVGFNRKKMLDVLGEGLVGRPLPDEATVSNFVAEHYHPMSWYAFLDEFWQQATLGSKAEANPGFATLQPLPAFFALALVGMVVLAVTPGPLQRFHVAWVLSLGGLWFAVHLAGVVNPRYRFVFEPFCLIYAILGLIGASVKIAGHLRDRFQRVTIKAAGERSPGQSSRVETVANTRKRSPERGGVDAPADEGAAR